MLFKQTSGQGQPLVLLHGWGFSSHIWQPLLPLLTPHYEVIQIDLPGHGKSQIEGEILPLPAMVNSLVQQTPPDSIWLGWSLGGLIAMKCAELYPQHIKKVLLVTSTPKFMSSADWQYGIDPQVLDQFGKQLQTNPQATIKSFIALQSMGSPQARQEAKELCANMEGHWPSLTGLQWGLELLKTLDFRPFLAAGICPVNALFGPNDTLVSLDLAHVLPQNYPNISTHVLPQAAHMPFFSHPALFMQWLNNACNTPTTH